MIKIAGRVHSPIALLIHRGRVSGTAYRTPIMVAPWRDGFAIALTYGRGVDWYKNLQASSEGGVKWHGQDYRVRNPVVLDPLEGCQAFGQPQKSILRWMKLADYIFVERERVPT